eukprot:m.209915 g.209915  ORF g.209915 m.209915 type:complete len:515 (-) comp24775_c0_seq1:56-1600(-)
MRRSARVVIVLVLALIGGWRCATAEVPDPAHHTGDAGSSDSSILEAILQSDPTYLHARGAVGGGCADVWDDGPEEPVPAGLHVAAVRTVPRMQWDNPCVARRLAQRLPVILTEADLLPTATQKWLPDYLIQHWPTAMPVPALETSRRDARGHPIFEYRNRAPPGLYNQGRFVVNESATVQRHVSMATMVTPTPSAPTATLTEEMMPLPLYSQGVPVDPGAYPADLQTDVYQWRWGRVNTLHDGAGWGTRLRSQLPQYMYIGGGHAMTPLHFDRGDNLLVQVHGTKDVLLWHPKEWQALSPFPMTHPSFQGSMHVDVFDVDTRSPAGRALATTTAYRARLSPGDVLYIPLFWWHVTQAGAAPYGLSISIQRPMESVPALPDDAIQHRLSTLLAMEAMAAHVLGTAAYVPVFKHVGALVHTEHVDVDTALRIALPTDGYTDLTTRWRRMADAGGWDMDDAVRWIVAPGRFEVPQYNDSGTVPHHDNAAAASAVSSAERTAHPTVDGQEPTLTHTEL